MVCPLLQADDQRRFAAFATLGVSSRFFGHLDDGSSLVLINFELVKIAHHVIMANASGVHLTNGGRKVRRTQEAIVGSLPVFC